MIDRLTEKDLLKLLKHFPVVGIVGPRQSGKTTLARKIAGKLKKEVIYIDLEDPADAARLSDPGLFLGPLANKTVILDEIQTTPDLFPVLRSLVDKKRTPGRFLILGSASPELIRNSNESLAGRIAFLELTPLLLPEIKRNTSLETHWLRGGFPDSLIPPDETISMIWRKNFVQSYVERDLYQLGLTADAILLRKMWQMLAGFHGNIWNAQNFSRSLGISGPTVNRYLHFMEQAFLIRSIQPFTINIKKRLVKAPKIYVRDSGILHYLNGISNYSDLTSDLIVGASWEGYVIDQIAGCLNDKYQIYFYRTHEGSEVDLVIVKGNKPLMSIEIKWSIAPKLTKGFRNSISDLRTKQNYIIIPGEANFPLAENVRAVDLNTFITGVLPNL